MDILFDESFEPYHHDEYDGNGEERIAVVERIVERIAVVERIVERIAVVESVEKVFLSIPEPQVEPPIPCVSGIVKTKSFRAPRIHNPPAVPSIEIINSLQTQMKMPAAAAQLGISPAALRCICRGYGIARWDNRVHVAAAERAFRPIFYMSNLRRRYGK